VERRCLALIFVAASWSSIIATSALAYDLAAHAAITLKALPRSSLGNALTALGFTNGLDAELSDGVIQQSVADWIAGGSKSEDMPDIRVVNHFHNPLANTWSQAGLRVIGIQPGQSSVLWQQNPRQQKGIGGDSGTWSWPTARDAYFDALTLPDEGKRNAAFARLFRSLGQVMHLLQDASLPAHTRNDPHLYKVVLGLDLGNPDRYERWVDHLQSNQLATRLSRSPVIPSTRLFSQIGTAARIDRAAAPAPVSGLIDTGQYDGTNPDVTATPFDGRPVIGLAEYSNANFFSNDTIFADVPALFGVRPFPSSQSLELGPLEPAPGARGGQRRYILKARHGDTTVSDPSGAPRHYRLALPGALYDYLADVVKARDSTIDEKVLEDYAALLLPRAVGYSAALIDHFFRGKLEAFFVPDPAASRPALRVVNRSDDERLAGTVSLHYDAADKVRVTLGRWGVDLAPGATSAPLPLPVPEFSDSELPTVEPGRYLLVFRGRLGDEPDAVIATPLDARIWVLESSVFQRERAGTITGYPYFSDVPLDTNPVLATYLSLYDSMSAFDGAAFRLSAGNGATGTLEYLFQCVGDNYVPEISATLPGHGFGYVAWYRGPAAFRPTTVRLLGSGMVETLVPEGQGYASIVGPAVFDVVRFRPPTSPGEIEGYSALNPPAVEAVLASFSVESLDSVDLGTIDLGDAAFVGIRLRSVPVATPAPLSTSGEGGFLDSICFQHILLRYGHEMPGFHYSGPYVNSAYAWVDMQILPDTR